jgi:hypothetical protein
MKSSKKKSKYSNRIVDKNDDSIIVSAIEKEYYLDYL